MANTPLTSEAAALGLTAAAPALDVLAPAAATNGSPASPAAAARRALNGASAEYVSPAIAAAAGIARRALSELVEAFNLVGDAAAFCAQVWGDDGPSKGVLLGLQGVYVSGLRGLCDERVEERPKLVSGCESALAAVKSEAVAQLAAHRGDGAAADVLRNELRAGKGAARSEVAFAGELAKLPDAAEALVNWEHRGPTNIDNLCLLCPSCHNHDIHRLGKTIAQHETGRYRINHNTDTNPPTGNHNQPMLTYRVRPSRRKCGKERIQREFGWCREAFVFLQRVRCWDRCDV